MKTIDNRTASNFISLRTGLQNADNGGYQVLTATLGTNGNGGQTASAEDLLIAGIEGYEPATFTAEEFSRHCKEAGLEGDGSPSDFLAFDRHQVNREGYLTGHVERVYIDLVA
jgi:hypothetical protein